MAHLEDVDFLSFKRGSITQHKMVSCWKEDGADAQAQKRGVNLSSSCNCSLSESKTVLRFQTYLGQILVRKISNLRRRNKDQVRELEADVRFQQSKWLLLTKFAEH